MKIKTLRPMFVEYLPEGLDEGVLYISEPFAIAGHKCCCGCGEEVITPLNQAQWQVINANGGVSLFPSIGNWKFTCKSHYWIKKNYVIDAVQRTKREIELANQRDRRDKNLYIQRFNKSHLDPKPIQSTGDQISILVRQALGNLRKWFGG